MADTPKPIEPSKREKIITEYVKKLKEDLKDYGTMDQFDIITEIANKVVVHKPAAGADYKRPPVE